MFDSKDDLTELEMEFAHDILNMDGSKSLCKRGAAPEAYKFFLASI
jgi:hypothetical protein